MYIYIHTDTHTKHTRDDGSLPKAGSWAFTPPGDEMSEVVSGCFPHRQLWMSNLSKVDTQWLEVNSNPQPSGCKAQNIPPHHASHTVYYI